MVHNVVKARLCGVPLEQGIKSVYCNPDETVGEVMRKIRASFNLSPRYVCLLLYQSKVLLEDMLVKNVLVEKGGDFTVILLQSGA
jgi:hypothetical protein